MTNKPNLDELFQSKKLDVPPDEFWDGFQDKVRERALSTVVQNGASSPVTKLLFVAIPSAVLCAVAVFFLLQTSSSVNSPVRLAVNVGDETEESSALLSRETQADESVEMISAVLTDLDSKGYLNPMGDEQDVLELVSDQQQNLYVHQTLRWADEDSSFEKHTIENKDAHQGDFVQFTF